MYNISVKQITVDVRSRSICPCCGTSITSGTTRVVGGLNESSSFEDIQSTWSGLGKSKHFDYHKCISCGTLVCLSYPDESDLVELYKKMAPNMEEAVDEIDQYRNQFSYARHIIKVLRDYNKANLESIQMLEVGADRGLLAKAISGAVGNKLERAVAIEPNKEVLTTLNATLEQSALEYQTYASFDEMSSNHTNTDRKFDVIAAIHVLDHTYDPFGTLSALQPFLSEKGIIYLVVHNPHSSLTRILGAKWPAYCAQHPQLFTQLGIRSLGGRLGFEVVRQGRTKNHFSISMLTDFLGFDLPLADKIKLKAPLGNRYYCLQRLTHK